jgi:hypothetical protein
VSNGMKPIGLEAPAFARGSRPATEVDVALPYSDVDYCRLAEECFFLAAAARDPACAGELIKAGDDYLRCAEAAPVSVS